METLQNRATVGFFMLGNLTVSKKGLLFCREQFFLLMGSCCSAKKSERTTTSRANLPKIFLQREKLFLQTIQLSLPLSRAQGCVIISFAILGGRLLFLLGQRAHFEHVYFLIQVFLYSIFHDFLD